MASGQERAEAEAWRLECWTPGCQQAPKSEGLATTSPRARQRKAHEKGYRIRSTGSLLTYQKFADAGVWLRFVSFVEQFLERHGIRHWCATMETNADGTYHLHVMLQFHKAKDRNSESFRFEGVCPNARPNDLLGEGWGGKRLQQSLDRGFFYVWADKEGTARSETGDPCVAANYWPAWTKERCTYAVQGRWVDSLLRAYKLSMDTYEEYIFLARDGVIYRKRNLDACRERALEKEMAKEVEERTKRIRSNPALYQPFREVPEALEWLQLFRYDALRYPVLLVHAPSHSGKTEWANSLFTKACEIKVGALAHFPESMRKFDKKKHDGLVVDDVRDLLFISDHQEKFQGKYSGPVEFASTVGGTCAYWRDLYRVPVVVTVNNTTKNLQLLQPGAHDFLSKRENVRYLRFTGRPGEVPPTTVWEPV